MRYRLAFREFGTCLGIGCHGGDDRLGGWADEIVNSWEKHMSQTPGDLRPITQVMYAAAIIPGGEFGRPSCSTTPADVQKLSK
jgi:hypothetical protein